MSKKSSYESGQEDGRHGFMSRLSNTDYRNGYYNGKQEYDYWNDKDLYPSLRHEGDDGFTSEGGSSYNNEPSTLMSMIYCSIGLTLFGWCSIGLILFLLWIGGSSDSWWFPWIWRIAFWGGIGFIGVMSIAGVVMAISEHRESKSFSEKPVDDPNEPWYKKYPPADVIKPQKKK